MNNTLTTFEKIPTRIFSNSVEGSVFVAETIASLIRERGKEGRHCVLGLDTGSTPTRLYAELVRIHTEVVHSFKDVCTFNLSEDDSMKSKKLYSDVRHRSVHLFLHQNIQRHNMHIPDGIIANNKISAYCAYEEYRNAKIGGIDIQVL